MEQIIKEPYQKTILRKIKIEKLFNKFDYDISLENQELISILYGLNGIGKTTILRIITMLHNYEFVGIYNFPFKRLEFIFSTFEVDKLIFTAHLFFEKGDKNQFRFLFYSEVFKFDRTYVEIQELDTLLKTELFKLKEMSDDIIRLDFEMENPEYETTLILGFLLFNFNCYYIESLRNNTKLFSNLENYYKSKKEEYSKFKQKIKDSSEIFEELLGSVPDIEVDVLGNFMQYFFDIKLKSISDDLKSRKIKRTESPLGDGEDIDLFESIINNLLDYKRIRVNINGLKVILDDEEMTELPLTSLSSGEKNLLVIFYDVIFEAGRNSLVLIDEPEISLNINWHYEFIDILREIGKSRGLYYLIATHSPEIVNNYIPNCVDATFK